MNRKLEEERRVRYFPSGSCEAILMVGVEKECDLKMLAT
jgi:hypothetical protein